MYGLYQIVYFTIIDILKTLYSPFFLLITIILYFQYNRTVQSPIKATITSIVYGVLGGIIATVSFIYLEVQVIPKDFIYIFIVAILLSLIDLRFICFAYGGSIVVFSNLIFGYPQIDSYEIMVVVAVLHMIESLLILLNGGSQKMISYFYIKEDMVGGFVFNRFWPIPFVIFIGDTMIRPITLIAILSYGDFTISNYPKRKTIETSIILLLYSSFLLIITFINKNKFIPPLFALLGHEAIMLFNKYREINKYPLYSDPLRGVRVLDIYSGTIASKLGIKRGDIILSINGVTVNSEKDIKDIIYTNPQKLTIKYFNITKGIVKKTYKGQKKTLGIVTFPKVLD